MKKFSFANQPEIKDTKVFDACGVAGFMNIDQSLVDGKKVKEMIGTMRDRENGLGGGFAGYGIFPEFEDQYCIQLLLDDNYVKDKVESYLNSVSKIVKDEKCPTGNNISPAPIIWRYFIDIPHTFGNADDFVVKIVMFINSNIDGAFCLSSGKNMAVFKGNGWATDVADFFQIERYKAHMWLSHSRFPTNTPGWWGGAHPFNILGYSVVHNGEITSYGTNKRYLEMYGYECTLLTDTEVVAYLIDLLIRKHGLTNILTCNVLAPPYHDEIKQMTNGHKDLFKVLRMNYAPAMLNGPFSILVGTNSNKPTLMGLTDRKKLRPLIAGMSEDENTIYLSSEESAIAKVEKNLGQVWAPRAGLPVIIETETGLISDGMNRRITRELYAN